MNNFGQIALNVGTRVGDTSAGFQTTINQYINQRYKRIFKRFNWPTIVPFYTFNTTIGVSDYILPSGFKHELYVYDSTNLLNIKKLDFAELERIYPNTLNNADVSCRYAIYEYVVPQQALFNDVTATFGSSNFTFDGTNTPANGALTKVIRFYQIPTAVLVIQMPYIQHGGTLSNASDLPIIDMADLASEYGATADAWRTKRQFEKAADFEVQYTEVINEMVWSIENDPNRVVQFRPTTYCRDDMYWGDGSQVY